ncbi:MAG: hypothetical protein PF447_07535 [Spirochaetaceae bacterium]|nr:hypothetical protein [Spirochaetaceae bacterium]
MRKKFFLSLLLLTQVAFLWSQNIETQGRQALDELAGQYLAERPQIYSKVTVSMVGINNVTEFAQKNYIGETLEEIIKLSLADSLVFSYIDRALLNAAMDEIKLSLSGITDESTVVEMGKIENGELLLSVAVYQEEDSFVLTLSLVDVETTSLSASTKIMLPQNALILRSEEIALESIVANGVGISFTGTPFYPLIAAQEPHVGVGQNEEINAMSGEIELAYRISKNLKVALSLNTMVHSIHCDTRSFSEALNVPQAGKDAAYDSEILLADGSVGGLDPNMIADASLFYFLDQTVFSIGIPVSYVWNPHRKISVSFNLGPTLNIINYKQVYDSFPIREGDNVSLQRLELLRTMMGVGFITGVRGEYFFLPRMAFNLGCSYIFNYTLPSQDPFTQSTTNGESFFSYDDRSYKAYGLNPFMMPNGQPIDESSFSANYFKVYMGVSMYF